MLEERLYRFRKMGCLPGSTCWEVEGESWKDHFSPLINASLRQHYQDGIAYSLQAKLIRKDIKVDDLLDNRFVEQGLKDLNLEGEWK